MRTVTSEHYLLRVINNAEDISLFLNYYNACNVDDVIRGTFEPDERLVVMFGEEKRTAMCKKKLPSRLAEAGMTYDESRYVFLTNDTLKDFVIKALQELKDGIFPSEETESVLIDETKEEVEVQELEESPKNIKEDSHQEEQVLTPESPGIDSVEPITVSTEEKSKITDGLCKYGVPKLEVKYLTPSVLGLQESLFVNVSEEDLSKFFNAVKGKVLGSITNDR